MAEALVRILLDRLGTIAGDKLRLLSRVEEEVKKLTRNLEAIQAVLEDAEQRQVTEASVRRWLNELTEVSYEMDDVLDEWITEAHKHRMEQQERQALAVTEKVHATAYSIFSFSKVWRLNHRRYIAVRIKELNERLALIEREKQSLHFQNTTKGPELPLRQTTTSLPGDKTFGRDEEKKVILSKLLSESSQECEILLIVPIVGMGGMGKTTLAQLVYNEENVKSVFDKRIWVCVSDPFDEIKIAKAIIEGLDKNSPSRNSNELQTLLQCIYELIEGKKVLLVLDDVWNPNLSQWEELIKPLQNGVRGSRILVTTRKEEVATLMKASTCVIHLNKLTEELCLSLFFYNANVEKSEYEVFQAIGKEIVEHCNGLPLAAKTLGSHMCDKKSIQEWQDVLSSNIWEHEEIEQHVFRPLLLSYNDLSPMIKHCLLYCVIFPKDYVYDRDNLIELWMSQGYLNESAGSLGKKTKGKLCFDTLVRRSFFQDIEADGFGKTRCKMHDMIHDFLQSLAKKECVIKESEPGDREGMVVAGSDKVRHMTLMHPSATEHLVSFTGCENLRTLVVFGSFSLASSIVQLKSLRTLDLSGSGIVEIPREIEELIHLRYLDLSYNINLEELPKTMSGLYNLQTLRLVNCHFLKVADLRRLINLRHLHVGSCDNLMLIGLDRLTNLQTLDRLVVQGVTELGHLENLNQLQGSLALVNLGEANDARKANLVNKVHLRHLLLNFTYDDSSGHEEHDRETLSALQPQPGLEILDITFYRGNTLWTDWFLTLNSLTRLYLGDCIYCEHLPPLGKLASLESLQIMSLLNLKMLGLEFLGIESETQTSSFVSFPKLKQLVIDGLYTLREWEGVEDSREEKDAEKRGVTIMPCLSSLCLSDNGQLQALPDFLWKTPLWYLHISGCHMLYELYRREGSGYEWAKISHIPNIIIDEPKVEDYGFY